VTNVDVPFYDNRFMPSGFLNVQITNGSEQARFLDRLQTYLPTGCPYLIGFSSSTSYLVIGGKPAVASSEERHWQAWIEQYRWLISELLEREIVSFFDIERVYCFDWEQFTENQWDDLVSIYQQLPGWQTHANLALPYWFGIDDQTPPHLWASFEPSGLQVSGMLLRDVWTTWDTLFRARSQALPKRQY